MAEKRSETAKERRKRLSNFPKGKLLSAEEKLGKVRPKKKPKSPKKKPKKSKK